ncbi:MAG: hypothetical protein LBJ10_03570 [Clostridiales bacterium]|jgi:hypothetical protein|nr:hypothetical protein [Clostridiales bacterium]
MPDGSMLLAVDDDGFGMGKSIIFRPDVASLGALRGGDVSSAILTVIRDAGGQAASLEYSISFFDLASEMGRSPPPSPPRTSLPPSRALRSRSTGRR